MRKVRAVILAAGAGTRLRPLTSATPKCLVPLAGRPLLAFWLDALADAGVREILINTHHLAEQVRRYIHTVNARGAIHVKETYEPELLGSAGTIAANRGFADAADAIIVVYADNLSEVTLGELLDFHDLHGAPVSMLLFRADQPERCGIATLDDHGRVVSFEEKPHHPRSNLANAGVYVLEPAAYREIADMNAADFGFDVLPEFVGRMFGWPMNDFHLDIGTPENYERAQSEARRILRSRGHGADGRRPAVFLDRDGTLIEHVHYLSDPSKVRLLPGAAASIRRFRKAGYACVVVSNQAGIAHGRITEAALGRVNEEICRQFAADGAVFDGLYHCPLAGLSSDRTVIDHEDRKPGAGMLRRAARKLNLDLGRSWMVGDMISDVLAGVNGGCRGSIRIAGAETRPYPIDDDRWFTVANITAAADVIIAAGVARRSGTSLVDYHRGVAAI